MAEVGANGRKTNTPLSKNFRSFQIVALPRLENLNDISEKESACMKTEGRSYGFYQDYMKGNLRLRCGM